MLALEIKLKLLPILFQLTAVFPVVCMLFESEGYDVITRNKLYLLVPAQTRVIFFLIGALQFKEQREGFRNAYTAVVFTLFHIENGLRKL